MPFQQSTILQIGDVHYPDATKERALVDLKDMAFPVSLQQRLATSKISTVAKHAQDFIDGGTIDFVLLAGDLTTYANVPAYEECVQFIKRSIVDGLIPFGRSDAMGITPGNHDLIRNSTLDVTVADKFAPFQAVHTKEKIRPLPILDPLFIELPAGPTARVQIALLNSCIGCGERKLLPPSVRDVIANEVKRQIDQEADKNKVLDILYHASQAIDTPMFDTSCLHTLERQIRQLPQTSLPIVCAHHNFLPQSRPRVDAYTDLLNAGAFRRLLLDLNRPVLFLHGHIHDDPVDVISDPKKPRAQVISISAPLMRDGFNLVTVGFGPGGVPVGCKITACRLSDNGTYEEAIHRVSFWRGLELPNVLSREARQLLEVLELGKEHYPPSALSTLRRKQKLTLDLNTLTERVQELEWLGLVSVDWAIDGGSGWRVRKVL